MACRACTAVIGFAATHQLPPLEGESPFWPGPLSAGGHPCLPDNITEAGTDFCEQTQVQCQLQPLSHCQEGVSHTPASAKLPYQDF